MNQLIDDLKAIQGVIGAFTWNSDNGLQSGNLPALFKADRLDEMARILSRIHASGRFNFPDLGETLVCFEEAAALCRQLGPGLYLLLLCDSSINTNLLTMSMNLALESYHTRPDTQPGNMAAGSRALTPEQLQSLQTTGPLAKPLQVMASELFTVMGPMAAIVFDEILLEWASAAPPSAARLPALLDGLCTEASDPEKARQYRQLVRSRLGGKNQ